MSYGIQPGAKPSADAHAFVAKYFKLIPHSFIRKWAICQEFDVAKQLRNGVRYFDLRFVIKSDEPVNQQFFFSHAVYSQEITKPLESMKDFLESHPKECVILDCHRIVGLTDDQQTVLMDQLLDIFGDRIAEPVQQDLSAWSLNEMQANRKQVFIVYRNSKATDKFWPSYVYPFAWLETRQPAKVKKYIEEELRGRRPYTGFISQLILAPTRLNRLFSNLRDSCARKILNDLSGWIEQQKPGVFNIDSTPTSNVIMGDFVDLEDWKFCKIVVNLNHKISVEI